jgi:hypothetical protein
VCVCVCVDAWLHEVNLVLMQQTEQRPLFMLEPTEGVCRLELLREAPDHLHNSLSDIVEEADGVSMDVRTGP